MRPLMSVDDTVIADGARAGDWSHAGTSELPAAIVVTMPYVSTARRTASSTMLEDVEPPRDMDMTLRELGTLSSLMTHWTPRTMSSQLATPWQFTTRTATRDAFLATPNVVPPAKPAQCVPWPMQVVSDSLPSMAKLAPKEARPPKSGWGAMPTSSTYTTMPVP